MGEKGYNAIFKRTKNPISCSCLIQDKLLSLSTISLASHRDKSISTIITNNITIHSSSHEVPIIFVQGHPCGPFHVFVTKLLFKRFKINT